MGRKKTFNKQTTKRIVGHCLFCDESDINLLDVHRIKEGAEGGTYCERNTVICCASCHRKIHSGRIVIEGKYYSTSGKWKVYCNIDGIEKIL